MYELFKVIAQAQGFIFKYATRDFQNLFNEVEEGSAHLFVEPIVIDKKMNDSGEEELRTFTGKFLIAVSSDHDTESYEQKYIDNIKPLLDSALKEIEIAVKCNSYAFVKWNITEMINVLDYNLDGYYVNYQTSIEV